MAETASSTRRTSSSSAGLSGVDDLTLASLLSSRICHDLVSPISAVSHGVAFLEGDSGEEEREAAMNVIRDGMRDARGRLSFYRSAFGVSSSLGEHVSTSELKEMADAFFAGGRVSVDWSGGEHTLARPLMRLLMNQILVVSEALPRGGRLQVGVVDRGALNMVVMADAPKIRMDARAEGLITRGEAPIEAPLEPKEAPLLLTHRLARDLRAKLTLAQEETQLVLAYTV